MPSASKNTQGGNVVPSLVGKLPKGRNVNLGSIAAAGDVVTFTISEPSGDSQGGMVIQVGPGGGTLGAGTFALEVSIDQGATWAVMPPGTPTMALTGQPGGDAAATFMAVYTISGFGSGATFKFGFVVVPTSGTYPVWGLIG